MKKIILIAIAFALITITCEMSNDLPASDTIEQHFLGVTVQVHGGENNIYLKQIGGDSLFVNVFRNKMGTNYIYYTKGNKVNSVSWNTGDKFHQEVSNVKIGNEEDK